MNSVLITGASTGIGEASALYLAERGWRVFAGVRRAEDAEKLQFASSNIKAIQLDVTKANQIGETFDIVRRTVGVDGLKGLVNNAGIANAGPLEFMPISELRTQMEVNFIGQVQVTQALIPLLRQGHGRVVNISSVDGRATFPFNVPYSASKHALEAFTDGLRRELLPWKIHVVNVVPGRIATPIWERSLKKADTMLASLPPEAEDFYGTAMERARNLIPNTGTQGFPPKAVARVVHHVLTARRPRTRYPVGRGTRLVIWLIRYLPDEWVDWLMERALYS